MKIEDKVTINSVSGDHYELSGPAAQEFRRQYYKGRSWFQIVVGEGSINGISFVESELIERRNIEHIHCTEYGIVQS